MFQQREWYQQDRQEEREYNAAQQYEARAYDRAQLDETRAYSRQVISNLVQDAEAAGFNPLTVMRSGGGSNYNAAAGLAPLSATPLTSSPAQMSQVPARKAVGGSSVGSAAGAIGDFLNNFDPFADTKKEQEYRLVESQIAALNASALSGASRGSASYASGDVERRASGLGGSLSKSGKNLPGEGTIVGGDDPASSSLGWNNGKYGWFHAGWYPDVENFEKIYGEGEVQSALFGAGKLLVDGGTSVLANGGSAYIDTRDYLFPKNVKKDLKYRKQYFDDIHQMVPSLSRRGR